MSDPFMPPDEGETKVELEEAWSREKAAKQEAARRPPPKPKKIGWIIAVLLLAGAVVAGVILYQRAPSGGEDESASSVERVRLEIRSRPVAKIRIAGKSYGKTPISVQVRRSSQELTIEATIEVQKFSLDGKEHRETHQLKQVVIPDQDRTVDFKLK